MSYSGIYIIYNPNSTGDSKSQAFALQKELQKNIPKITIECVATKRAGHGEELAYNFAKNESSPLIVSASGDGGYNDVINGVIRANNPKALCAVLPTGNANDHSRTMHQEPIAKSIIKEKITNIDVLQADIQKAGKTVTRYAHSYIGLGLTPVVAVELNKHSLNAARELLIVLKTFFKFRPFKIKHDGKIYKLDSLLFGNINQMAKVLTIAPQNRPDDGKFEVVLFPSGRKVSLVRRLAQAAVSKLENVERAQTYSFTVIKTMPVQLDGEVLTIKHNSQVTITSRHKLLRTVI